MTKFQPGMSSRLLIAIAAAFASISIQTVSFAKPPAVIAHRGLLLHAPENTLSNFRACLNIRVGFEFDVAKTKDGHLICIHDDTVDRTTSGTGRVSDLTLVEITQLDAGSWFDDRFVGDKVPTVEQVLELISQYKDLDVLIAVDLKAEGVEADVVRLAQKHGVLHRLLFIGSTISNADVRDRIRSVAPSAQTAAVANDPSEFRDALQWANADWVYFRYLPPQEQMVAVQNASKRSFIAGATVSGNVPSNWRQAIDAEIDAILTDFPLELLTILRNDR